MARSQQNNPLAFPHEVARYLCVAPRDVPDLIESDGLPVLVIPAKTRHVQRIPLRDFHQWVLKRTKDKKTLLTSYELFMEDFNAAARSA